MYFLMKRKLRVPVRPNEIRLDEDMDAIILRILRGELEGTVKEDLGYVVAVISAKADEIGDILHGSPNIFFDVETDLLVYKPFPGEIIEGEIVDVTQQAVYVNLGPVDAYLPTTRLLHGKFRFDAKEGVLRDPKTKIVIKKGDLIRAKITSVDFRVPELVKPLVRGTIAKPAVLVRPKSEIRIRLRADEGGLGLIQRIEDRREELMKAL